MSPPTCSIFEYQCDRLAGRPDVRAPPHLDVHAPLTAWRHRSQFFAAWLRSLRAARGSCD